MIKQKTNHDTYDMGLFYNLKVYLYTEKQRQIERERETDRERDRDRDRDDDRQKSRERMIKQKTNHDMIWVCFIR